MLPPIPTLTPTLTPIPTPTPTSTPTLPSCKAAASRDAAQLRAIPAQLTELIVSPPAGAATADGGAADVTAWRGACASGFALLMAPMPRLLVRGRGARLLSLQQQRTLEARLTKTVAHARARPRARAHAHPRARPRPSLSPGPHPGPSPHSRSPKPTQACLPPLLAAQAAAPPEGAARRALLAAVAACVVHAPPPLLRAQAARTVPLLVQWLQLSAAALYPTAPLPAAEPPTAPAPAAPPSATLDGRAVQLLVDLVAVGGLSR